MATTGISSRRKASKRSTLAAVEPPATANGPVQTAAAAAVDPAPVVAPKKPKAVDPGPGASCKTKFKKENDVCVSHKVEVENHDKENQDARQVLVFNWTTEELTQLITNLTACLPRNDNVKYTTLIDKLDWEKVRFGQYTAAQCKDKWMQIVTKLRRFRTLTDMVTDAKEWLKHPWSSYSSSKKQKHPETPKKPLTPYFRYFLEKREKYSKDNPEMSMTDLAKLLSKKFQQLPDKKKQKYKEAYEKENEIYKQDLEKFKKCHPEQFPSPELRQSTITEGPDKPHTAFNIFVNDKLKKNEFNQIDRREAMEKLRKQWNVLSDNKKVKWIRKAIQDEQRYGIEIEKYRSEHPNFHPEPVKAVLSKAEKELKDRCDGKPERPPNSGYSLFSRIKLRELKDFPSKAKMAEISRMWKQLSDPDRESMNKQAQQAIAKYKEEYAAYLNNLPENEREKLEVETKTNNKKRIANHITFETIKNDISELEAINGNKPKKPFSAMFYFQQEKFSVTRQKHPDMSKQDMMKVLAKEYNELPEKRKDKYKKIAEEAKKSYDESSTSKVKHDSSGKKKLFKGEPKRPPQSGYGLFSTEKLSELTNVDPKNRMTEIAKLWKSMSSQEKDKYAKRVQEMMRKYNKDMKSFLKGLTIEEFQEYDKYRKSTMKKKNRKNADSLQKNSKKETDSDSSEDDTSEDDDESEKSEDVDESVSGSASGSGSASATDDSGSDSATDEDDDEDDDDEKKEIEENDSSSSDTDSDTGTVSDSGSGTEETTDSGTETEEEKSG